MNVLVLAECSESAFAEMGEELSPFQPVLASTERCSEEKEVAAIRELLARNGSSSLIVIKFSGRISVAKEIGDTCSDIVIVISVSPDSPFYLPEPVRTLATPIIRIKQYGEYINA